MRNRPLAVVLLTLCLLVLPARAAADPTAESTKAAVESVLEAMEKSVLAGDADGYMQHVARGDLVFLQEQLMWAADLKRHVPSEFLLRIVDPAEKAANEEASKAAESGEKKPAEGDKPKADEAKDDEPVWPHEFTADRAVFELEMIWKITVPKADGEAGEPDQLDRSVSYPVIFARDGSKWLFKGENWVEVRADPNAAAEEKPEDGDAARPEAPANAAASTKNNLVLCFPGFEEVSQRIAGVLPEVRSHVDGVFGQEVAHQQVVKVYPTMRHLQASIYLSYVDGLSGWNEPKESIKVLVRPTSRPSSLRPLLAHEYGHCATFEYGPKATDIPWWALEGVAELSSEAFRRSLRDRINERVGKWFAENKLADFAKITDFRNTPNEFMGHVYTQGHHMVGYITDRFGDAKRNAWFKAMANGAGIDEATVKELGVKGGFAELDKDWRSELDKRAKEAQKQEDAGDEKAT